MTQRLSSKQQWFQNNVINKRNNGISSSVGKAFQHFYREHYFSLPVHLNTAIKEYEQLLKESAERNHFTFKREVCPWRKVQCFYIDYEKQEEEEEFVKVTKRTKPRVRTEIMQSDKRNCLF